jgi:hypothetical protein
VKIEIALEVKIAIMIPAMKTPLDIPDIVLSSDILILSTYCMIHSGYMFSRTARALRASRFSKFSVSSPSVKRQCFAALKNC